jgi:hypothetical protein
MYATNGTCCTSQLTVGGPGWNGVFASSTSSGGKCIYVTIGMCCTS